MRKVIRPGDVSLPAGTLSSAIFEAILAMEPSNKENWTEKGEPAVERLERIMAVHQNALTPDTKQHVEKVNITESQRDAVWKQARVGKKTLREYLKEVK